MPSRILILGFGISGKAAAKLARFLGDEIVVADEKDGAALRAAAASILPREAKLLAAWTPATPLPECDLIVVSPGLAESSPLLKAAKASGKPLASELEYGFRHLPCPALAITGTNGKTTTTELTTCLLNAAGLKVEAAGNIGEGLSEAAIAATERKLDLIVAEVSSFQLELVDAFAPKAAAILNIASDHINRHGGMEGYAKVKFKVFERMERKTETTLVNANMAEWTAKLMPEGPAPTRFSSDGSDAEFQFKDGFLVFKGERLLDFSKCELKGVHNAENALAALALVRAVLGDKALRDRRVLDALASFKAGAYRIETFAEWKSVKFVDDSKGTNPHAVVAAVKAFPPETKIDLLLGGLDKGMDFSPLLEIAPRVRHAALVGQCREKILQALGGAVDCELCESFKDAVRKLCEAAKPGDAVMLSPACASMDMFKDYKDRGDSFKRLVREWLAERV